MKALPYQLIAVFTDSSARARGNISAVVQLDEALSEAEMAAIAQDLNQPATTFVLADNETGEQHLRWFAPDAEIGLCGHGTAAAAAFLGLKNGSGHFHFKAGKHLLSAEVDCAASSFTMELDAIDTDRKVAIEDELLEGLGIDIEGHYLTGNKNIVLIKSEADLARMQPKWHLLRSLPHFGYAVTARSKQYDFVSRTLVPKVQQLEDHATGSSHAALVPFWAERLGKNTMRAAQLSKRKGIFHARVHGEKVQLSGKYELLSEGVYFLK